MIQAHAPTQAASFSGPGKQAVVLYAPAWGDTLLEVLQRKPSAYEASWSFEEERRAHVLRIAYEGGPEIGIALIDGIHNAILAQVVKGSALVLSPHPLYRDPPDQPVEQLFEPELSLVLPELPNPLG
ncbi:MAG TPA: hypothetical protein VD902_16280 [Symbiobacteriaceae bacterium]|nr:hypothetical protein [Symbiobacteriaceae bacterium]